MAKNLVRQEFLSDGFFTAPAGVTAVRVLTLLTLPPQIATAKDGSFCAGISTDGNAYGWGLGSDGQLDNGANGVKRSTPTIITGGPAVGWQQLAIGSNNTLALAANGNAYGFGANSSGQLGDGTTVGKSTPTLIVGTNVYWRQLSQGGGASIGIRALAGNPAYAWGSNGSGQLGDNTIVSKSTPTLVQGGKIWRQVEMSGNMCIGIDDNDDAYCWGAGLTGAIGDGNILSRSTPTLVSGGLKWRQVTAGNLFAMGITLGGDLYAWGDNTYGQLGQGTFGIANNKSTPTLISSSQKWRQVSAGFRNLPMFALGIDATGQAYGWGDNSFGQLGNGNTAARSTPTVVSSNAIGSRYVQISAGGLSSLAIDTLGNAWGWGDGSEGQIGDNTATTRSSPTLVQAADYPWRAGREIQVNEQIIPINPGQLFPVTVNSVVTSFGHIPTYQSQNSQGNYLMKIVVEYQA